MLRTRRSRIQFVFGLVVAVVLPLLLVIPLDMLDGRDGRYDVLPQWLVSVSIYAWLFAGACMIAMSLVGFVAAIRDWFDKGLADD